MRTLLLENLRWPEIKTALDTGEIDTVIVCAGSIEQHGPHLPENTDTVLGYQMALDLAKRLGHALVAPLIRPGLSAHHMVLPGTISLRPEIFKGLIEEYVSAYVRHGFKKIILIASHGGNFTAVGEIAKEADEKYRDQGVRVVSSFSVSYLTALLKSLEAEEGVPDGAFGAHADAWETSEMLLFAPENVDMSLADVGFTGFLDEAMLEHFFKHGVLALSANGICGDPRYSDPERGRRIFDRLQDDLEKFVREALNE